MCGSVTMAWARAPEVFFAAGHRFVQGGGSWSGANRASYSAFVVVWAWAMIMVQIAMGRHPLEAHTDLASAQRLLDAGGLGKCRRATHGRDEIISVASVNGWPDAKLGY